MASWHTCRGPAVTVVPPAAAYMAACYSSLEVTVIIFMLAYSGFQCEQQVHVPRRLSLPNAWHHCVQGRD